METTGWKSWLTTVDHKKIGIMYFVSSFIFLLIGGIEALTIRTQLATPEGTFLSADLYNQIFTMHGLTMIFFGVMPMSAAFFNYLMPLQIGARDVAFPRINALSFWVFLAAGIFLFSSVFFGGCPRRRVDRLRAAQHRRSRPGQPELRDRSAHQPDALLLPGLQIAGIASLASAVNFIVTIFNMRAPA
jgi:cytochrome c oxidase subunit I